MEENHKSLISVNNSLVKIANQISIGNKILELANQSYILLISKDYVIQIMTIEDYKEMCKNLVLNKLRKNNLLQNLIYIELVSKASFIIFFTQSGTYFSTSFNKLLKFNNLNDYFDISLKHEIIDIISFDENLNKVEGKKILFATRNGLIKRSKINLFHKECLKDEIAIKLYKNDLLKKVMIVDDNDQIILGTKCGQILRFYANKIKVISKKTFGNKGVTLYKEDDNLIDLDAVNNPRAFVLIITENAHSKLTMLVDDDDEDVYRITNKGGKGVKTAEINKITGFILFAKIVYKDEKYLVTTNLENMFVLNVSNLSIRTRTDIPKKLFNLKDGEKIMTLTKLPTLEIADL